MSEIKDESIQLVESDPAEIKDDEKKVATEEITEAGMESGGVTDAIEQAKGIIKADKESETEKACLIENKSEVECFKKDFFEECSNKQHFYWQYVRPLAAEFITSMILIFNVCSLPWPNTYQALTDSNASFVTSHPLEISQEMPLMPAFTAGFTVFALLTMFHYVTIAHISPTVTFGFALSGNFDFKLVVPYILAQILGAITGAALAMIGSGHGDLVGVVGLPDAMTTAQLTALLIAEMQVSFILCLSTNLVVGNKNWDMPVATLMIGLCVFTGIMAGHMSGAGAMNPARVLGPAILAGNFNYHWVWWVASLLGSLQCAAVYKLFFAEEEKLFGFVRQATKKTYTEIPTNNDA